MGDRQVETRNFNISIFYSAMYPKEISMGSTCGISNCLVSNCRSPIWCTFFEYATPIYPSALKLVHPVPSCVTLHETIVIHTGKHIMLKQQFDKEKQFFLIFESILLCQLTCGVYSLLKDKTGNGLVYAD